MVVREVARKGGRDTAEPGTGFCNLGGGQTVVSKKGEIDKNPVHKKTEGVL